MEGYDLVGLGDDDPMVRPAVSSALGVGYLCPLLDPVIDVVTSANAHDSTSLDVR